LKTVWLAFVISYLLGSLSFSTIIGKYVYGIDIRRYGSGNAGATNTLRVLGKKPAAAVFLLDMLKGTLAVGVGWSLSGGDEAVAVFSGVFAVIGHNWPLFFRFRGGKGIATTIGVVAVVAFPPAALAGAVALLAIAVTRYVSLGSLLFTGLLPLFVFLWYDSPSLFAGTVVIALLAFWRHRQNIANLLHGRERKLGERVKVG